MKTSKKLTIFSGCDGSGKTTAAREFAELSGAKYVHFNNLPRVKRGLARMYVEAMLPALLGYEDVVFDRSWLCETPYGEAFREGRDRLTQADHRMLERLAMRCGAIVVHCDPGYDRAEANFLTRNGREYLKTTSQLRQVYDAYKIQPCQLMVVIYNYVHGNMESELMATIENRRFACHPLRLASAGCWSAQAILVGDSFAERKDQDPWYQWPFGSFSGEGCSQWLTNQLIGAGIPESEMLWINADQDLSFIHDLVPSRSVIALGAVAASALSKQGVDWWAVDHPQYHKRFKADKTYPLITRLNYPTLGAIHE